MGNLNGVLRQLIIAIRVRLAANEVKAALGAINKIKNALSGLAAIYFAKKVYSFFSQMIEETTAAALKLDALSKKLGMGVGFLQAFQLTAEATGVSLTRSVRAIERFNQRIGEARLGVRHSALAFGHLHVQLTDVAGQAKDNEEIFFATAAALVAIKDDAERARLAAAVFGESGAELMPVLMTMGTEFESMRGLIKAYGAELDDTSRIQDLRYRKSLIEMRILTLGLKRSLVGAVIPALLKAGREISAFFLRHRDGIKRTMQVIGNAVGWFANALGTMVATIADAGRRIVAHYDNIIKPFAEGHPKLVAFLKLLAIGAGLWVLWLLPISRLAVALYFLFDLMRDWNLMLAGKDSFFLKLKNLLKDWDETVTNESIDKLDRWGRALRNVFAAAKGLLSLKAFIESMAKEGELEGHYMSLMTEHGLSEKDIQRLRERDIEKRDANYKKAYDALRQMSDSLEILFYDTPTKSGGVRPPVVQPKLPPGSIGPSGMNIHINNEIQTGPTISTAEDIGEEVGMSTSQLLRRELQRSGFLLTVQSLA